ncbi:ATP-binding protein [Dyella nitratireducens]|uniref:histidine kinase n=1 Tax=Dyella nitratireducens TaxID=1849580 RepID=A0ABQ1G3A3_9GAMM|nr:ATP-binding protein [Dyella nitratireducens]GGA35103.1 histidine kinase [Dyella nitratireducens]GLQ40951.1 histidine kinase [Dyella nitratireducens]
MLPSKVNIRRLSRTAWARIFFIGILLLLAAFSWHPMGASMSGAFDKVWFDTASRLFAHPGSNQVAVVLIDDKTLGEYGTDGITARTRALLQRLDQAASITLDYPLGNDMHTEALAVAMAHSARIVLPVVGGGAGQKADTLPGILGAAAAGRGQRHVTLGHYGVVTGFVPYLSATQGGYPNIVLEAIRVADAEHVHEQSHVHRRSYALSMSRSRTDAVLVMLGGQQPLPQYSFADVLDGKVPANAFDDRIVFVGEAVGEDAGFQISSLNMDAVSRPQLDALMTDAVLSGNMASELPGIAAVPIYLAIALGMVLICALIPGRWMHAAALGWFLLMFLVPVLLLAVLHRWLGLGLLPLVGVFIYTHFAWERLRRTQNLLKREVGKLRAIASAVNVAEAAAPAPSGPIRDPLREARHVMREMRSLQSTFVSMINQLPYPVFVVVDQKVSVWNGAAADMLAEPVGDQASISLGDVQQLVRKHCRGDESTSVEITLGGREHMLFYVPYASADTSLHPRLEEERVSFLVCLVDITRIKQSITHDKQALRHIAHDLRSPLSTILALIEERAEGQHQETPHDRAFLEDLRRQADYSLRVAKDFLQLSRAEQIHRDSFVPVALLDVATEAVDQLWPTAESKAIELIGPECDLDDTLLMGSPDMLIRALVNVIDNALKYSPSHTAITVRLVDESEDGMVLHIVDQGIGIAEEDLPHLFDPFFQAGGGKSEGDMGVGLGLPFVKAVIERHGGAMTVASQLGQGTDFRMVLPRA